MPTKLTPTQARQKILALNLTLLSQYNGYDNRCTVSCNTCGHVREVRPRYLFCKKSGCPECARRSRSLSQDDVQGLLELKGITLVGEYISSGHSIDLICKCGHKWHTTTTQILHRGAGCPKCAGNIKYTTTEIQSRLPPDVCLVSEYKGMNSPITVKCASGHTWITLASNLIHQHSRCPECYPYQHNKKFGRKTVVDGIVFMSMLEAECYTFLSTHHVPFERQKKYPHNPRMRCDFYLNGSWIEVSSFKNEKYLDKIKQKRAAVQAIGESFVFISSVNDFKSVVKRLTTPQSIESV